MFDTLEYAEELKAAGVPEGQAHVQARALSRLTEEKLATKDDLAILKTDLAHVEERLRGEIAKSKRNFPERSPRSERNFPERSPRSKRNFPDKSIPWKNGWADS